MLSSTCRGYHYDVAAVDAGNIVYPMHPERSEAIRRWATNVGREQSHHDVTSSHSRDANGVVGGMPIEASIASAESDTMTMCPDSEEGIPERIMRTAHILNLANSTVYPPELPHANPPQPPSFAHTRPPVRPRVTRQTSMFSGSSNIVLAGGTFTNCAGSVNVTYASNGGRTVINRNVDSNGNVTVTRILNSGTVNNSGRGRASWDKENQPEIQLESNMFSGIKDTIFTGGTFTHAPQFNCVVYGQGSPDTINARPNGLPPRHLRSSTPPPAYTSRG